MRRPSITARLGFALFLVTLGASIASARADASRGIVFFGDSLKDPGKPLHRLPTGDPAPYPPVPIYPYAMGGHHFGPTWAEDLTDELDMPVSGKPALREPGVFTNYAVGRARARPGAPVFPDFDLGTQAGAFLTDFGGQAPADRTYVIWIGANDLFDALEAPQVDPTGAASMGIIQPAIGATAESVQVCHRFRSGNSTSMHSCTPWLHHPPATLISSALLRASVVTTPKEADTALTH